MNINVVTVSAVTLASLLSKPGNSCSSSYFRREHFSRQDRVLCFLQAAAQKPALGENYRGPHQKQGLPDVLEDASDQRSEGKQFLAKYNTSSKQSSKELMLEGQALNSFFRKINC